MANGTVTVKVWDGWVRLFHWSTVLLLIASYVTAKLRWIEWHMLSGGLLLGLVLFRLAWGFVGSETARFAQFLAGPRAAIRHFASLRQGAEAEAHPGHNPAGGWMVMALLGLLLVQGTTGLFSDDAELYRGAFADWIGYDSSQVASAWHQRLFDLLLIAIGLHVAAIAIYRVAFGRRLVGAMITGRTAMPAGTTPPRGGNRVLGALLLAASMALGVYLWRLSLF